MKTMTIGTKAQADKVLTASLFKPVNGETLTAMPYDGGKYKPGSYVGREVSVSDSVHALYATRGRDSEGPYVRIMCVCE